MLLPAAHAWLLVSAPGRRPRRRAAVAARPGGPARPALLVVAYYVARRAVAARRGVDGLRPRRRRRARGRRALALTGFAAVLWATVAILRVRRGLPIPPRRTPTTRWSRAARAATPVPARSAARSPPCDDDHPRRPHDAQERPEYAPPIPPARGVLHALSTVLIVSGVLLLPTRASPSPGRSPSPRSTTSSSSPRWPASSTTTLAGKLAPTSIEKRALAVAARPSSRIAFAARVAGPQGQAPASRSAASASREIGRRQGHRRGNERRATCQKGPGHYPDHAAARRARERSRSPGHRTTYGAPFRSVDDLRKGDDASRSRCRTRRSPTRSSARGSSTPSATWVVARRRFDRLVLTACHPLYSAAKRIVVFAKQVKTEPARSLF